MLKQIILRCICGGFVVRHISKFTYLVYCMNKKDRGNRVEWLINVVYSFFFFRSVACGTMRGRIITKF